jgi:hypothetical protein
VKRVVFNIADTSPEPEHLSPDKSTLTFAPQRLVRLCASHLTLSCGWPFCDRHQRRSLSPCGKR